MRVVLVYGDIFILVSGAYMLVLLHWWVFPICWDYCIGEWSLYVGIIILVECSLYVGIAILVSVPNMLGLLYWWSVPYMLALLYWWVFLISWDCYIGERSLYVGIVTLVSGPMLVLLFWWVITTCFDCFTGEWSYMLVLLYWWVVLYIGIVILVECS
jgi:hypothetical protein